MEEKIFIKIKCDSCGTEEKRYLSSMDINLYEEDYLIDALRAEGWNYLEGKDICPTCRKNIRSEILFHLNYHNDIYV